MAIACGKLPLFLRTNVTLPAEAVSDFFENLRLFGGFSFTPSLRVTLAPAEGPPSTRTNRSAMAAGTARSPRRRVRRDVTIDPSVSFPADGRSREVRLQTRSQSTVN